MLKVSIIIPVYKVEKYIARCINSVLKQNYDNIECVIVNDCTPDNSFLIAKDLVADYKGGISFVFLENKKNAGLSATRNVGVLNSTGDYLFFLDSDDWLPEDSISSMVKVACDNHLPDIVMGVTRAGFGNEVTSDICSSENKSFYSNEDVINGFFGGEWYIIACNKLIRRETFIKNKLFFRESLIHEDELWSFEIAFHINSLIVCNKITYYYDVSNVNSITHSTQKKQDAEAQLTILEEKAKYLGKSRYDKTLSAHIKGAAITLIYTSFRNGCKTKDMKYIIQRVRRLFDEYNLKKAEVMIPFYRVAVYKVLDFIL